MYRSTTLLRLSRNMAEEEALFMDTEEAALRLLDDIIHDNTLNLLNSVSNADKSNALVIATRRGYVTCVEPLLKAGANPNAADELGYSPLAFLAAQGLLDSILTLLASPRCLINKRTFSQRTALHFAAERGHNKCVRLLINRGAMVNVSDDWGLTPLILAVTSGSFDTVETLLEHGALTAASDLRGHDAFIYASKVGNESLLRKFIQNGYQFHVPSKTTAMHQAARFGHANCVKALLDAGMVANRRDIDNCLPIVLATQTDQFQVVQCFLENGLKQYEKDAALIESAKHNAVQSLMLLLDSDADPKATDERGISAFFLAVAEGFTEVAITFLQHGCDINKPQNTMRLLNSELQDVCSHYLLDNISPLMCALLRGNSKMVKLLIEAGADIQCLTYPLKSGILPPSLKDDTQMLSYLLDSLNQRTPTLLRDQCRRVIRGCMREQVQTQIELLPLPPLIQRYVAFEDLYDL